jgi:hypothetical protein
MRRSFNIKYDPFHHRLRCSGHIINLAVKSFLFVTDNETLEADDAEEITDRWLKSTIKEIEQWRKKGPLGKLHNFIVFVQKSTQRMQKFLALSHNRHLARDNSTRWNSWYHMLEVALLLKDAIIDYFSNWMETEVAADELDTTEWELLREIKTFLELLKSTTKSMESITHGLDRVLPAMDFILAQFEKAKTTYKDNEHLKQMVNSGWSKMEKYYSKSDESPAYAAAVVLNPSRKWQYIDQYWRQSWREPTKQAVRRLWEDQYKPDELSPSTAFQSAPITSTNEYELWLQAVDTPRNLLDEYDRYCKADLIYGFKSALDWWLEPAQQKAYPNLQRMALDILSIPPMSADPERAFSAAKITITDRRNKLQMEMIEYLECLKSWTGKTEWIEDRCDTTSTKYEILIGPEVIEDGGSEVEAEC